MSLHILSGELTATPPFDFNQSLTFLAGFRSERGAFQIEDETFTRAITIDGVPIAFRVHSVGTVEAPKLAYTLYSEEPITPEQQAAAEDRIRFYFSLDDDVRPLYKLGAKDGAFASVLKYLHGYHQVKFITPFENAVWAVLSQRNLFAISINMKQALVDRFGESITVDGFTYRTFPEPYRLAVLSPDEASEIVNHKVKGALLPELARAFDGMDELWLREAPYDEVEKWLRSIRGIGPWTASFVLLRGLGHMNRLPVAEKWLMQAAGRVYGLGNEVDQGTIERIGARYGDQIGYWSHYLRAADV